MMAQNLVEALIMSNDEPRDTDNSIITLPHMRRLSVSKPEVLSHLRSPALEGLVLMVGEGRRNAGNVVRNLETLIDRSGCSLRRLGLQEHPDADSTVQILTKFSSITELVISNNKRDRVAAKSIDALMKTLTVSSKSPAVAPHLSLIVFDRGGADYGTTTFIKMIESRWRAGNCALATAGVITDASHPLGLCSLHALRQEGLEFLVIDSPAALNDWLYLTSWML
jgi:endonuclease III